MHCIGSRLNCFACEGHVVLAPAGGAIAKENGPAPSPAAVSSGDSSRSAGRAGAFLRPG